VGEKLKVGSIVRAVLDDHHGKASEHFAIVIASSESIVRGDDLAVVGISTSFKYPLPPHWYPLETRPGGHPITGLHEACVAKADWFNVIKQSDILEIRGRAPSRIVKQIALYIRDNS
jgi:hypothetical protein